MSTQESLAALATYDKINIEYEQAYEDNEAKEACIAQAISLLPQRSKVLDVGCGTGVPVAAMLSTAGLDVVGFDVSPKMVAWAQQRIPGVFSVADMLGYTIEENESFAGVFMIYCHLQLSYKEFHTAVWKFVRALQPGGLFVIAQCPSDDYVRDERDYDETRTYAEGFNLPFMGETVSMLLLSREGQKDFFRSMGLEIVWELIDIYRPKNEICDPEFNQYVIARRPINKKELTPPKPLPK